MSDFEIKDGVLTKYNGPGGDVVIPERVKNIGAMAFYGCSKLTSMTIPEGVTSIKDSAFSWCSNLTSVTIPESVTSIGDSAFSGCSKLTSVTIPAGVTSIGHSAFDGCKSLTSVTIPDSVTSIGSEAFRGCLQLHDEQGLVIVRGVLYDCANKYTRSVTIPEGVTSIGDYAFSGCRSLEIVTIPDSVTSIGSEAFRGCLQLHDEQGFVVIRGVLYDCVDKGIASVTIPDGVTSIGGGAFFRCSSLTDVTIPEGVTSIDNFAFADCTSLTNVTIPESVISIGERAFDGCSKLTSVTIPETVTSIGKEAFARCSSLTKMTIPEGVTSIGVKAFSGCSKLTSVTIPESVTSIGERAFDGCNSLTSVTIPAGVDFLGNYIFAECGALQEIVLLSPVPKVSKRTLSSDAHVSFPNLCLKTRENMSSVIADNCTINNPEEYAYILLYQAANIWGPHLAAAKMHPSEVISHMIRLVGEDQKVASARMSAIISFISQNADSLNREEVQALWDVLKSKSKNAEKTFREDETIAAILEGSYENRTNNPIESVVRSLTKGIAWDNSILKQVSKGIHYADGSGICSKEALMFLVQKYAELWEQCSVDVDGKMSPVNVLADGSKLTVSKPADQIASALDREELSTFLAPLASGPFYRKFILAYTRFATEKSIEQFISGVKHDMRGSAKEQYRANSSIQALYLSNTTSAMMYLDSTGNLEGYAKMRGTDAEVLRNTVLEDFGLDADGKKTYNLGCKTVTASIGRDLTIELYDEAVGKPVKSLPKKDADPDKFATANEDLSNLKKSVKNVVKTRNDQLSSDFFTGNTYNAENWKKTYLDNPVLRRVAEHLVWSQKANTFTLDADGPIWSDGSEYVLSDKPIAVAHPMEMKADDLRRWQSYFVSHALKQPFEQVWEPVIDPKTIRPDRYEGMEVSVFRFMHMDKHGITFYDEDFHNEIGFHLEGCELFYERTHYHRHEIAKDETFTLGEFSFKKYTRQVNHIVALLDRWTVSGRILKDDVTVREVLDTFTAAQIMEFIGVATQNNCPNCTAMLLEYKQEHYPDFDPMAEFTLE